MAELNEFQIATERQLTDQLAAHGLMVVDRTVKGQSEAFIEGRVADVRFWIYLDEACIIGRGTDRVFERWDFDSPSDLRAAFIETMLRLVAPPGSASSTSR